MADAAPEVGRDRHATVVLLVAVAAYAISLVGEFAYDDVFAIQSSTCVTGTLDLSEMLGRNFWCQDPGNQTIDAWRPVPVFAWWLTWKLGGGAPWAFHLLNVGLHACVSVAVARLSARWFSAQIPSIGLWSGLAFAALPIHADAVAANVGAAELWAALFGVLALLQVSSAPGVTGSLRRWATAIGLLALALASKESAVAFFVLAGVIAAHGRSTRPAKAARIAALLASLGLMLWVRAEVLGAWVGAHQTFEGNPLVGASAFERLAMAPSLLGRYVALSAVGFPLSADYSYDQIPVAWISGYAVLGLATVTLAAFVAWTRRDRPPLLWAALWFLGASALVLNVLALLPVIFAERLFYSPSIPLCIAVGWGMAKLEAARGRRGRVLAGLVIFAWALGAMQHAWWWTTQSRIAEVTAEHSPRSARAQLAWARELGRRADVEGMLEHAQIAHDILPTWPTAQAVLAQALDANGAPKRALPLFVEASGAAPRDAEVMDLFIVFLLKYGHVEQAQLVFERHVQANGGAAAAHVTRPPARP